LLATLTATQASHVTIATYITENVPLLTELNHRIETHDKSTVLAFNRTPEYQQTNSHMNQLIAKTANTIRPFITRDKEPKKSKLSTRALDSDIFPSRTSVSEVNLEVVKINSMITIENR